MAFDILSTASAAVAFGLSALAVCLATVAAASLSRRRHDRSDSAPAATAGALAAAWLAAVLAAALGLGRLPDPWSWSPPVAGVMLMAAVAAGGRATPLGRAARAVLLDGAAARLIGLPVRRLGIATATGAAASAVTAGIVVAAGWPELPPATLLSAALAGTGAGSGTFTVGAVVLAAAGGALAIGLIAAPIWILPCCVLLGSLTTALTLRHA